MTRKPILVLAVALVLVLAFAAIAQAQGPGPSGDTPRCGVYGDFVDEDGDGVCDNWVDEDGDGINDAAPQDGTGQKYGQANRSGMIPRMNAQAGPGLQTRSFAGQRSFNRMQGSQAFADEDGDGICDNWVDEDGDGINDAAPQDGSGQQHGFGRMGGRGIHR